MPRRYRLPRLDSQPVARVVTLVAVLLPLLPLRGLVVPADNAGYLDFIEAAPSAHGGGDLTAKQYVGIFYSWVEAVIPYWVFTNAVFFLYLWFATLAIRTFSAYMVAIVLTLPMFIHFNYVSKEAILGFLAVLGVLATIAFGKRIGQYTLIAGVVAFAIFVRPYYALPIAATAIVMLFGRRRGIAVILLGVIASLLVFPLPFEILEGSRRQMYLAGVLSFGTRSLYPNVVIDDTIPLQWESMVNYAIVAFETLVPMSWTISLKDVFAQLFILAVLVLVIASAKVSDRLFSTFGISLILTVPLFSPDLGTSMRHIAAAALYLHLGVALQRMYDGGRLDFRPQQVLPIYELKPQPHRQRRIRQGPSRHPRFGGEDPRMAPDSPV